MLFPIIKGLERRLVSSDILTFYNKSNRAENDQYNKIRECIFTNVCNIPYFLIDDNYIEEWSYIYTLTINLLEEISGSSDFSIIQKAGRKNNNDFELLSNEKKYLLEFKSNNIPQIASIYCNNNIVSELDYPGYFYDNYLSRLVNNNIPMISRNDYLKDVYKTKPSLTENEYFFAYLKENSKNVFLINESINLFLQENYMKFNLQKLTEYLITNLTNKIIILYHCDNTEYSIVKRLNRVDVELLKIDSNILNNNTVIIYSETIKFKFLLRWKNHKGCLGPAWQISYQYLT